jgi:hypothetical protein
MERSLGKRSALVCAQVHSWWFIAGFAEIPLFRQDILLTE